VIPDADTWGKLIMGVIAGVFGMWGRDFIRHRNWRESRAVQRIGENRTLLHQLLVAVDQVKAEAASEQANEAWRAAQRQYRAAEAPGQKELEELVVHVDMWLARHHWGLEAFREDAVDRLVEEARRENRHMELEAERRLSVLPWPDWMK
jgi:hypothetical protein